MRCILAVLLLILFSNQAYSEDGLVLQLTIEERVESSERMDSYTNAISMGFNDEVSGPLHNLYEIRVRTRQNTPTNLNILITLKDIIDGKPYYAGAKPVDLDIGEKTVLNFQLEKTTYRMLLDSSYGKI